MKNKHSAPRGTAVHFIPRTVTMQEAADAKSGLDLQGAASLLMAMMQASTGADGHNAMMEQLASAMGYKLVPATPQIQTKPRQRSRSKKARAARYAQTKLSLVKANGVAKPTPAEPIRSRDDFNAIAAYLRTQGRPYNRQRNYTLFICGVTLGLRVGDLLRLTVDDVWDCEHNCPRHRVIIINEKTGKRTNDLITPLAAGAITTLIEEMRGRTMNVLKPGWPLFQSMRSPKGVPQPLDETQVWRILNHAAKECGIKEHISTHSLRKTYGYAANSAMTEAGLPAGQVMETLQNKFHHSSQSITMRYIGLSQEQIDATAMAVDTILGQTEYSNA